MKRSICYRFCLMCHSFSSVDRQPNTKYSDEDLLFQWIDGEMNFSDHLLDKQRITNSHSIYLNKKTRMKVSDNWQMIILFLIHPSFINRYWCAWMYLMVNAMHIFDESSHRPENDKKKKTHTKLRDSGL